MQKSESIDFTSVSNWCNGVLRYNNWYNKSSILLLFSAFFCFSKNYKVNKYSTLSAKGYLQNYYRDNSGLLQWLFPDFPTENPLLNGMFCYICNGLVLTQRH